MSRPRVVIIGGGFGGLYTARALAKEPVQVTLLDQRNHHIFSPLLYQVATAALNPSDIAAPIRSILRGQENCDVVLARVSGIDLAKRRVTLDGEELEYDHLVVATGTTHSYFGNNGWAAHAPGLKSIEDALDIRRRMLFAYEAAEREPDPEVRRAWLTFVIVGAGPTGVEMAGAMAEVARRTLVNDFHHIDPGQARVLLVEGQDRVLPGGFAATLAPKAQNQLEKLGAEVMLNVRVTAIDEGGVTLQPARNDGGGPTRIAARTVMWAAGVLASPLARSLGVPLDKVGRVLVEPDLSVPGHPEVFVVGDLASLVEKGKPVPGLAPAAIQGGKQTAANIMRQVRQEPTKPFHYTDKGSLATIGRAAAVGSIAGMNLSGFSAWFMWAFVHLMYLMGFRNRLLVFISWVWSYLVFERGARLITNVDPDAATPVGTKIEPAAVERPRAQA